MANSRSQSKNWLLTPHLSAPAFEGKEDEWFIETLMANPLVQACGGQREVAPETGAVHMQLFVRLNTGKRESYVRRHPLFGEGNGCNVQRGDGKWQKMLAYCTWEYYPQPYASKPELSGCRKRMDEHDALTDGEWPEEAQGKRNDILFMIEYAATYRDATFAEAGYATNGASIRYRGSWNQLMEEEGEPRDPNVPHTAEWYFGEGRIGKSWLANSENPGAYRKTTGNRWWPMYKGQKTVIYDEFAGRKGQKQS